MTTFIRNYHQKVRGLSTSHPVLTLTITNTALAAVADTLGQTVTQLVAMTNGSSQPLVFDVLRLIRFTSYQSAITPILYQWLLFLERTIPVPVTPQQQAGTPITLENGGIPPMDSTTPLLTNRKSYVPPPVLDIPNVRASTRVLFKPVVKRVILDQFVFAPISMAVFFVCMSIMEGGGLAQIQQKLYEVTCISIFINLNFFN